MNSALLRGTVTHTRRTPKPHALRYRLHLFDLDLDELEHAFAGRIGYAHERFAVVSFRRRDYHGDAGVPLREAVLARVEAELGARPDGRVRIVTQLRTLGYLFNPVSFYLCHDADGALACVMAEINNTPWNERFSYVLDARDKTELVWRFPKRFHVSPFFDMDQEYEWRFSVADDAFGVHMTNFEAGRAVFHAGFEGARTPLDRAGLTGALLRYPLQPLRMHAAIYLHAARLFLKGVPFFTHPKKRPHAGLIETHE